MAETELVPSRNASRNEADQSTLAVNSPTATEAGSADKPQEQPLFTGSCFCKTINFTLSSSPIKSYICHCLDCRRITGTSFAHNSLFPFSCLAVSSNDDERRTENLRSEADGNSPLSMFGNARTGGLQFCKKCGTRMFLFAKAGAQGEVEHVVVPAGIIDGSHEDDRLKPTEEGYCRRRENWMADMRGTRVFEEW